MKKKILLIAPLIDIPTITSNLLAYDLLAYLGRDNIKDKFDVDLLWGLGANRLSFDFYTKFKKYDLVMYVGHGTKNNLKGEHLFGSIINKNNISRLKDSIVLTMACSSAAELGRVAIQKGVKAYIGGEDLIYASYPEKERNYLDDWRDEYGTYFKEVIDGKNVYEAYRDFQRKMTHYIKIYDMEGEYRNFDWYKESALHNQKITILLGDPNAKL